MFTLSEAIERRFPLDDEWARTALDTLGDLHDEASVHDIAQGWLRVGGDAGVLVDTLFVLTEDRLGFGQTQAVTGQPNWIELVKVVALDAIEGLPYPLIAVEVQIAGGIAMLVGWPGEFCDQVVDVLTRSVQRAREAQAPASDTADRLPPEFADPAASAEHADASTIETLSPSSWVEATVDGPPVAEASPWGRSPWSTDSSVDAPVAEEQPVDDHRDDVAFETQEPTAPSGFQPLFGAGEAEHDERVEAFFNPDDVGPYEEPARGFDVGSTPSETDGDPSSAWAPPSPEDRVGDPDEPADQSVRPAASTPTAFSSRSISWPEPFRPTTFLGDHPEHSRRRKNVSLGFSPAGITAVSTGFNAWKLHLLWDDVRDLEFEGADEVKFTHNHRIDMNGTAVIVTLTDNSTLVFEIRSRRPAMVRSTMAPIVNALASHRAFLSGNDDSSGHGTTFTF
jgi:hypothetical protein